mgnify:FL=1
MRIAHFGAYGINIGDNIALKNVRRGIEDSFTHPISWTSINILDFHAQKNNIEFCKSEFKRISKEHDLFIIGGGGLLEGGVYNSGFATGYKLPFTSETLEYLTIPIVVFGVGVNYFRLVDGFTPLGAEEVKGLIEKSLLFSVRNDGSKEAISSLVGDTSTVIYEVPDPGLLYIKESEDKETIDPEKILFQPAWNGDHRVLAGRFIRDINILEISKFVKQNKLPIIPHSPKDYNFSGLPQEQFITSTSEFKSLATLENVYNFTDRYSDFSAVIAMRGHGQLISIGANVPSLYLSTQDKVTNFSKKNGFEDYNIDILEYDWVGKLESLYHKIIQDPQYITRWHKIRLNCITKCRQDFKEYCDLISSSV